MHVQSEFLGLLMQYLCMYVLYNVTYDLWLRNKRVGRISWFILQNQDSKTYRFRYSVKSSINELFDVVNAL